MNDKDKKFFLSVTQPDGTIEEMEVTPFDMDKMLDVARLTVVRLRDKDGNIVGKFETDDPLVFNAERIEIKKEDETTTKRKES